MGDFRLFGQIRLEVGSDQRSDLLLDDLLNGLERTDPEEQRNYAAVDHHRHHAGGRFVAAVQSCQPLEFLGVNRPGGDLERRPLGRIDQFLDRSTDGQEPGLIQVLWRQQPVEMVLRLFHGGSYPLGVTHVIFDTRFRQVKLLRWTILASFHKTKITRVSFPKPGFFVPRILPRV